LDEVVLHAGCKALMEVDNISALIVSDLQTILGQQLKPNPSQRLNIIVISFITY
jgi:hypothetical protein